jgi:hypothetical protein
VDLQHRADDEGITVSECMRPSVALNRFVDDRGSAAPVWWHIARLIAGTVAITTTRTPKVCCVRGSSSAWPSGRSRRPDMAFPC